VRGGWGAGGMSGQRAHLSEGGGGLDSGPLFLGDFVVGEGDLAQHEQQPRGLRLAGEGEVVQLVGGHPARVVKGKVGGHPGHPGEGEGGASWAGGAKGPSEHRNQRVRVQGAALALLLLLWSGPVSLSVLARQCTLA